MIEKKNTIRLFNTPLEIGLRSLIILNLLGNKMIDIEKLMYLDYLCLHTSDIGGPESLHAPIPHRGVQVFAKKELINKGLTLMLSKELIELKSTTEGFMYSISDAGKLFLNYFQSTYFTKLVERSKWVITKFDNLSTSEVKKFIDSNIQKWGGEFSLASNPN